MSAKRKKQKYILEEIDAFDARSGLKRCSIPGVGVSMGRYKADADFWRDRSGVLVVRLSRRGYVHHFVAMLVSFKDIPNDKMKDFEICIRDALRKWLYEGTGGLYNAIYDLLL